MIAEDDDGAAPLMAGQIRFVANWEGNLRGMFRQKSVGHPKIIGVIVGGFRSLVVLEDDRAVFIEEVDGLPPDQTKLSGPLLETGFKATSKGYLRRL